MTSIRASAFAGPCKHLNSFSQSDQDQDLGPWELVDCIESGPSQMEWSTVRRVWQRKKGGEEGGQMLCKLLLLQASRALPCQ